MTDQSLSKSQVMEAIAAGNSDDLYFQPVQLNTTDDCTLNCGVPGTLSLEGRFVGSWPNYNNTEVVLDLRDVRFETLSLIHI